MRFFRDFLKKNFPRWDFLKIFNQNFLQDRIFNGYFEKKILKKDFRYHQWLKDFWGYWGNFEENWAKLG